MRSKFFQLAHKGCNFFLSEQTSFSDLIVLGFNDTSTLVGHFVLSPREGRKETEEIVEEMKERTGKKEEQE